MPLPTCAVTCTIYGPDGQPLAGALVTATLSAAEIDGGMVVPRRVNGMTDADGVCVLDLWPNARGSLGSTYTVAYKAHAQGDETTLGTGIAVPADAAANLEDLIAQGVQDAVPGVSPAVAYWSDPKAQEGAVLDGETDTTDQHQDCFDRVRDAAYPDPAKEHGKGGLLVARPGIAVMEEQIVSTWQGIHSAGPQGSAVWVLRHEHNDPPEAGDSPLTGTRALLRYDDDSGQASGIGSQPAIIGKALHGDKGRYSEDSTATEHGIYMPDLVGDKDDAPVIEDTIVANFKGNGIHLGRGHKQLRLRSSKSVAHDGWSFYGDHSSDSKLIQPGFGRSVLGQVYLEDCASMQFLQFDFWNPGGGAFGGLYAMELVSCRNTRFYQGEIQGVVRILGDNCEDGVQTQHQDVGCVFAGFNIKVSPETYAGTQYVGGGGSTTYDAMVQVRGANAIKFADGIFGYSQGPATAEEITATPKYIFEFTVDSGRDFDKEAGYVEISNVSMIHMHYVDGVRNAQVPMSRHWAKNPERVIWRTQKPGEIVFRPLVATEINLLRADGSTITGGRDKYPLLAMGQSNAYNHAQGANRDLTLPNCAALEAVLPAGWGAFVVAW